MLGMKPRADRGQGGQMLVGVIVFVALVLLAGTGMALAVSTGLHQVDQTAAQDASSYSAESAVTRGLARGDALLPLPDTCESSWVSEKDAVNRQATKSRICK